jgi:hypothetical protein
MEEPSPLEKCELYNCQGRQPKTQRTCIGLLRLQHDLQLLKHTVVVHNELAEAKPTWEHNRHAQLYSVQKAGYMKERGALPIICAGYVAAHQRNENAGLSWHEECMPNMRRGVSGKSHVIATPVKGTDKWTVRSEKGLSENACPWCLVACGLDPTSGKALMPGAQHPAWQCHHALVNALNDI